MRFGELPEVAGNVHFHFQQTLPGNPFDSNRRLTFARERPRCVDDGLQPVMQMGQQVGELGDLHSGQSHREFRGTAGAERP